MTIVIKYEIKSLKSAKMNSETVRKWGWLSNRVWFREYWCRFPRKNKVIWNNLEGVGGDLWKQYVLCKVYEELKEDIIWFK